MRPKLMSLVLSRVLASAALGALSASLADDAKAKGKEKITYPDHVAPHLPQPLRHLPQPRQGQGGPEPRQLRRGHARGRLGQGDRAGRSRRQLAPGRDHPQGRAQDAPQLAQDPRRRDRRSSASGSRAERSRARAAWPRSRPSRSSSSSSTPRRWASRPARRRCPRTCRPSRSSPQAKPSAVVAMAASPWAPLVAIGGHKQVLLYRTTDNHLVGVLPFPEGTIHVLRFSRNGDLLLAGGGRGGPVGSGRGVQRQDGPARLRGRQGIRRRPRRRHQPRPRPGRPRRARARSSASTTRPTAT